MNDSCGCCEAPVSPTPKTIDNRPGLSAIAYRVGEFASFRQAMLQAISGQDELAGWTTRASDDYGIALLEMWAYLGDILTFYQERIANEAFLNTAVFRESVKRLAALLDYEPSSGVAAATYLAFTVEKGATVEISPAMRVQSVPGQGETPQKFETGETLTAVSALNQFRVYPRPQTDWPLALNRTAATAIGDIDHLAPGDRIVVFEEGQPAEGASIPVEDKEIDDIQSVDWRQELHWAPALRRTFGGSARVYKWKNKFRLFGRNAPSTFLASSVDSAGNVTWQQASTDFYLDGGTTLDLDAVYDDLKENAELLVVAKRLGGGAVVRRATVSAAGQANAQLKDDGGTWIAQEGTVTKLSLSPGLPTNIDVRTAVIYELEGPQIGLWDKVYLGSISGDRIYVPLVDLDLDLENADDVAEAEKLLEPGRRIILEDDEGRVLATTVAETAVEGDHLKITLDDAPTEALDAGTARARANVVQATHGETVADEVLGSGDAATTFQSFSLKKSPVTFVPKAGAKNGVANTLEIRVDGVLWREADTLYGQGGDERTYTTSVDNDGVMTAKFGDGQTGARLPTGSSNVVATYRQGIGQNGNVGAGSLTTLLDKPVGLKKGVNVTAAEGGSDPESLENARANAPNTVRTFDRIVSLRDFEDAARAYSGVSKARAAWQWDGAEQVVLLTVAGDEGATVEPGGQTHSNLVADLDSRRDPNRTMRVDSYEPVAIQVVAAIQVDGDYVSKDVQTEALAALSDYFDFDNLDLGQPIHLSGVYRVLQNVEGVVAVDVDRLQFKRAADRASHGASARPVQAHLTIFSTELATVEDETSDLIVNLGLS